MAIINVEIIPIEKDSFVKYNSLMIALILGAYF